MEKIVLASASPRRRELLAAAGMEFEVIASDVDENINVHTPSLLVQELALLKAAAVAKELSSPALVIGADTVVYIGGEILGKPCDAKEARTMLKRLSGRLHKVYTGVCVIYSKTGKAVSKCEVTNVIFHPLSKKQIRDYVKSKEPLDKAGAYGIQGPGKKLVRGIIGSYDNVVGLPLKLLKNILKDEFDYTQN